jgi:hypothetical protein
MTVPAVLPASLPDAADVINTLRAGVIDRAQRIPVFGKGVTIPVLGAGVPSRPVAPFVRADGWPPPLLAISRGPDQRAHTGDGFLGLFQPGDDPGPVSPVIPHPVTAGRPVCLIANPADVLAGSMTGVAAGLSYVLSAVAAAQACRNARSHVRQYSAEAEQLTNWAERLAAVVAALPSDWYPPLAAAHNDALRPPKVPLRAGYQRVPISLI